MSDNQAAEQNRARFDRAAAEWDANPVRVALARAVAGAIRSCVPLRPEMRAMDFGAGTGLITLALLPDLAGVTAVDTSGEMLRMLDQKLRSLRIGNVQTLLCEPGGMTALPAAAFDLIVSSMVLHHIPDVPQTLRRLRDCLRPGGWIALADLDSEDGTFHADATGVFHHGFDRGDIRRWLQAAGFVKTAEREAHRIVRPSEAGQAREYPVFLVTGQNL